MVDGWSKTPSWQQMLHMAGQPPRPQPKKEGMWPENSEMWGHSTIGDTWTGWP